MPYAPGIQDISGELLAQGMREKARGIAGGAVNWLQGYEQNQQLKNQSLAAFSGLLGSDPDFQAYVNNVASGGVQVPDAVKKAIKNYQSGNIDVYDAAILGNTGQMFARHKGDAITRAHIQAQTAGNVADAMTKLADLGYYANQPGSTITPEMLSNVQRFITSTTGAQPNQPQAAQRPSADVLTNLAGITQPTARTVTQPTTIEEQPKPSVELPEGAVQLGRRSREEQMAEAMKAVKDLPPSQQKRSLNTVLGDIQKRDLDLSRNVFFSDPQKADAYRAQLEKTSKAEGLKWTVDSDPRTGYLTVKQVPSTFESASDAARRARLTKSAEVSAANAGAYIDMVRKEGAGAANSKFINEEIDRLLSEGVQTGPLEETKAKAAKLLSALGVENEDAIKKANSFDELDALMMRQQLEFAQNATRGNLNTFEQQLVQRAVDNARAKMPGANRYLNRVVLALKLKQEDRQREEKRLRKDYPDETDRAQELADWELNSDNSVRTYMDKIGGSKASPAANESASDMAARLIREAQGKK